jgi:hypothetical protein
MSKLSGEIAMTSVALATDLRPAPDRPAGHACRSQVHDQAKQSGRSGPAGERDLLPAIMFLMRGAMFPRSIVTIYI